MAEAMCLCAMLGRESLLRALVAGCPQATGRMLEKPLYEDFFAVQFDVTATAITPLMVALIFREQRCAEVIYPTVDPHGTLFEYESAGNPGRIINATGFKGYSVFADLKAL